MKHPDEIRDCPFCGEADFDAIGLKTHLTNGYCEPFEATRQITTRRNLAPEPASARVPESQEEAGFRWSQRLFDRIVEATQIARMAGTFNEAIFKLGLTVILREELAALQAAAERPKGSQDEEIPALLAEWWAWCNAHPHALDTVAKRPAAVIDALWAELERYRHPKGET